MADQPLPTSAAAAAYRAHYDVLRHIAASRYAVPAADIRPLIHDVFVSFLRNHGRIGDERAWLVGAICNACRRYWTDRGRTDAAPLHDADDVAAADAARVHVELEHFLRGLSASCREVLRMRHVHGLSPAEIARTLRTSPGYVKVLVHRCLKSARKLALRVVGKAG